MIFWTIDISLAFYALAVGLLIAGRNDQSRRLARLAWTIAFGLYVAHMVSAYHFQHHWSQADALRHAAQRTYDVVGVDWDGGIYVNYIFTLIWLIDVAWWWVDASGHQRRPKWLTYGIHAFLAFIAFNSTVVFAQGPVRWIGLAITIGLAVLWVTQPANSFSLRPLRTPVQNKKKVNRRVAETAEKGKNGRLILRLGVSAVQNEFYDRSRSSRLGNLFTPGGAPSGLFETHFNRIPRALPWAVLFQPVGLQRLKIREEAAKDSCLQAENSTLKTSTYSRALASEIRSAGSSSGSMGMS